MSSFKRSQRKYVKKAYRVRSSGLSVHVGQLRNPPRDRDYRKLHLCVDELTADVIACDLTRKSASDSTRVASLGAAVKFPLKASQNKTEFVSAW